MRHPEDRLLGPLMSFWLCVPEPEAPNLLRCLWLAVLDKFDL